MKQLKVFKYIFTVICLLYWGTSGARELRCNVSVNASKIQGTNKNVFNTLQSSLSEFMNGSNWTNNTFTPEELIDCSFTITVTEYSGSRIGGKLQILARRPVYGSTYQTVTLNFVDDDFVVDYTEFDRLDFNLGSFNSNLTSIMAFYAYIVLGVDFDTFSLKGGDENFDKANQILVNAQKENYPGWNPYESSSKRNKYWLISNITDSKYSPERGAYYKYHRLGLDQMRYKPTAGRENIIDALTDIQRVYIERPDPYLFYMRVFFDAKSDELVDVFSTAPEQDKAKVYQILNEIDSNNSKKYAKLKK